MIEDVSFSFYVLFAFFRICSTKFFSPFLSFLILPFLQPTRRPSAQKRQKQNSQKDSSWSLKRKKKKRKKKQLQKNPFPFYPIYCAPPPCLGPLSKLEVTVHFLISFVLPPAASDTLVCLWTSGLFFGREFVTPLLVLILFLTFTPHPAGIDGRPHHWTVIIRSSSSFPSLVTRFQPETRPLGNWCLHIYPARRRKAICN